MCFCERRWALVHIEQQWEENRFTAEGRVLHERVHGAGTEARPGVVIARGIHLRSLRLGISGVSDVVEFHVVASAGVTLPNRDGLWRPFPVEYKRGRPSGERSFEVQLCAQALCLEEMLGGAIDTGALFHGAVRRRTEVRFDAELRGRTESLVRRMHELYAAGRTPLAVYAKKCDRCSLYQRCLPRTVEKRSAKRYMARALRASEIEP